MIKKIKKWYLLRLIRRSNCGLDGDGDIIMIGNKKYYVNLLSNNLTYLECVKDNRIKNLYGRLNKIMRWPFV